MTETPDELRARGLAKMNEVYGWDMADQKGDFFAVTADHLFADIWTRPGLEIRERRLLLIGALAASGKHDILDIQLDSALRLGEVDADSLREIVIFLAHYLGWPTAATLSGQVEKLIAKHRDANTPTGVDGEGQ
jgi:4-carboxymuconolactone decarboxylase